MKNKEGWSVSKQNRSRSLYTMVSFDLDKIYATLERYVINDVIWF